MRIKEISKKRYEEISNMLPSHGTIEGITVKFEAGDKTYLVVTGDAFDNSFRHTFVYERIKQTSEDGKPEIKLERIADFDEGDVLDHFDLPKFKHRLVVAIAAREKDAKKQKAP